MKLAKIRRPFKVEFIEGPINGAVRYYSTYKVAKSVAKRYCSKPTPGHVIFEYPSCEIYAIDETFHPILLEVIM